jgi:hypothetical protein
MAAAGAHNLESCPLQRPHYILAPHAGKSCHTLTR